MDEDPSNRIRAHMEAKGTDELLDIWKANDRSQYRDEAFEIIRQVLMGRGVKPPEQRSAKVPSADQVRSTNGKGGFFSFRTMVSGEIIKLLYAIGALGITGFAFVTMLDGNEEGLAASVGLGLVILIGGNLLWRVVCEAWILLFSMQEILAAIERKIG